jgi:hypothetical protein
VTGPGIRIRDVERGGERRRAQRLGPAAGVDQRDRRSEDGVELRRRGGSGPRRPSPGSSGRRRSGPERPEEREHVPKVALGAEVVVIGAAHREDRDRRVAQRGDRREVDQVLQRTGEQAAIDRRSLPQPFGENTPGRNAFSAPWPRTNRPGENPFLSPPLSAIWRTRARIRRGADADASADPTWG